MSHATFRPALLPVACAALLLLAVAGAWAGAPARKPAAPHPRPAPAASPFTGIWEAVLTSEGRQFSFDLDLHARGDTLTGTVEGSFTDRVFPITHGRVRGNSIAFEAIGEWTGTLAGRALQLVRELDGGKKQSMLAHRKAGA